MAEQLGIATLVLDVDAKALDAQLARVRKAIEGFNPKFTGVTKGLTDLATQAEEATKQVQSLNQVLNQAPGASFAKITSQIQRLTRESQNLKIASQEYVNVLQRISELEITRNSRVGRQRTMADFNAYRGAVLTRGYGAADRLPPLPPTIAGDGQRIRELTKQINNLEPGTAAYNRALRELETTQQRVTRITSGVSDEFLRVQAIQDRIAAQRQVSTSGFGAASAANFRSGSTDPEQKARRRNTEQRVQLLAREASPAALEADLRRSQELRRISARILTQAEVSQGGFGEASASNFRTTTRAAERLRQIAEENTQLERRLGLERDLARVQRERFAEERRARVQAVQDRIAAQRQVGTDGFGAASAANFRTGPTDPTQKARRRNAEQLAQLLAREASPSALEADLRRTQQLRQISERIAAQADLSIGGFGAASAANFASTNPVSKALRRRNERVERDAARQQRIDQAASAAEQERLLNLDLLRNRLNREREQRDAGGPGFGDFSASNFRGGSTDPVSKAIRRNAERTAQRAAAEAPRLAALAEIQGRIDLARQTRADGGFGSASAANFGVTDPIQKSIRRNADKRARRNAEESLAAQRAVLDRDLTLVRRQRIGERAPKPTPFPEVRPLRINPAWGLESAVIGGAFPLLFGQGVGASAGGLVGGLAGVLGGAAGFAGSLVGTAIGAQFDAAVRNRGTLGSASRDPVANFGALRDASLLSSSGLERTVQALIDVGREAEAAAVIQSDLARSYGDLSSARDLNSATDDLKRAWSELGVTIATVTSGPLAGLARTLSSLLDPTPTGPAVADRQRSSNTLLAAGSGVAALGGALAFTPFAPAAAPLLAVGGITAAIGWSLRPPEGTRRGAGPGDDLLFEAAARVFGDRADRAGRFERTATFKDSAGLARDAYNYRINALELRRQNAIAALPAGSTPGALNARRIQERAINAQFAQERARLDVGQAPTVTTSGERRVAGLTAANNIVELFDRLGTQNISGEVLGRSRFGITAKGLEDTVRGSLRAADIARAEADAALERRRRDPRAADPFNALLAADTAQATATQQFRSFQVAGRNLLADGTRELADLQLARQSALLGVQGIGLQERQNRLQFRQLDLQTEGLDLSADDIRASRNDLIAAFNEQSQRLPAKERDRLAVATQRQLRALDFQKRGLDLERESASISKDATGLDAQRLALSRLEAERNLSRINEQVVKVTSDLASINEKLNASISELAAKAWNVEVTVNGTDNAQVLGDVVSASQ